MPPTSPPSELNSQFDPEHIVAILRRHEVKYLLVGGVACRLYGARRATSDLDLVPSGELDNLEQLARALRHLGARLRVGGISQREIASLLIPLDGRTLRAFGTSTWMTNYGPVDVLLSMRTSPTRYETYSDLLQRASSVDLETGPLLLASLDDIIASKSTANRPKDRQALPELRRLRELS